MSQSTPTSPAGGKTASERYLSELARRSFLSLWSHNNLQSDEGRQNGKGDGKELCDLLVVFGNHVLVFSDKACAFQTDLEIDVAWARWYRRAVQKSAKQLLGARNWLTRYPQRIFVDSKCQRPFPYEIPAEEHAIFHLIAVTRGSYKPCREFFGGKSTGSLMINTAISSGEYFDNPFTVGLVEAGGQYIHVLDELTLEVVLRELDTITDLVDYLQRKEVFLTNPAYAVIATGEEQLVAMYLSRLDKSGQHNFIEIPPDVNLVHVEEGQWEDFIKNPQYLAKKRADRESYAWDGLIEVFTREGDVDPIHGVERMSALEPALRVLASESRLARRQLGASLLEAIHRNVPRGSRFLRVGHSLIDPSTLYVFLILPLPAREIDYATYRRVRREFLHACCHVARWQRSEAKRVVGITMEPAGSGGSSEDLLFIDYSEREWSHEDEEEARRLQMQLQILQDGKVERYERKDSEYPDLSSAGSPTQG